MNRLWIFLLLAQTALAARMASWASNNVSQLAYVNNSRLVISLCNNLWEEIDHWQNLALPPEMMSNGSLDIFPFDQYDTDAIGLVYQSYSGSINLAIYLCSDTQLVGPTWLSSLSQTAGISDDDIRIGTDLTALLSVDPWDPYYDAHLNTTYGMIRTIYQDKNNVGMKVNCYFTSSSGEDFSIHCEPEDQVSPLKYQTPGLTAAIDSTAHNNSTTIISVFQVNEGELFISHSYSTKRVYDTSRLDPIGWPVAIKSPDVMSGSGAYIPATGAKVDLQQNITDSLAVAIDPRGPSGIWVFFVNSSGIINAVTNTDPDFVYTDPVLGSWGNNMNFTTTDFDVMYTILGEADPYYGISVSTDPVMGLIKLSWIRPHGLPYVMWWDGTFGNFTGVSRQPLPIVMNAKDIPKEATQGMVAGKKGSLSKGQIAGITVGSVVAVALLCGIAFWRFTPRKANGRPRWMLGRWRDWKRLHGENPP